MFWIPNGAYVSGILGSENVPGGTLTGAKVESKTSIFLL